MRNEQGLRKLLDRATHRANWYAAKYPKANNFAKHRVLNYWQPIRSYMDRHQVTADQVKFLADNIPAEFKNENTMLSAFGTDLMIEAGLIRYNGRCV